jgi:hypothetical protein
MPMKKWAHELNREFLKEELLQIKEELQQIHEEVFNFPGYKRDANQNYTKISSPPVRMATFKGNNNNKCWRGCGETGTLIHCWWECKLVQPLWKAV